MIPAALATLSTVIQAKPQLDKLKKATDGFETQFVKQLVTEMRKSSKNEFADEPGSDIYDDMTNQILAEKISSKGGFGVSNVMFKQLSQRVLSEQAQQNGNKL
jgi:Rod binding domain-containing protein